MSAQPLDLPDRVELAHTELGMVEPPRTEDEVIDVAVHWSVAEWHDPDVPDEDQVDFDTIHEALRGTLR